VRSEASGPYRWTNRVRSSVRTGRLMDVPCRATRVRSNAPRDCPVVRQHPTRLGAFLVVSNVNIQLDRWHFNESRLTSKCLSPHPTTGSHGVFGLIMSRMNAGRNAEQVEPRVDERVPVSGTGPEIGAAVLLGREPTLDITAIDSAAVVCRLQVASALSTRTSTSAKAPCSMSGPERDGSARPSTVLSCQLHEADASAVEPPSLGVSARI
jgi:hypothetical protein